MRRVPSSEHFPGILGEISHGEQSCECPDNRISLDDPVTLARAADKLAAHKMLAQHNVRVPRQLTLKVDQFEEALKMLRTSRLPLRH